MDQEQAVTGSACQPDLSGLTVGEIAGVLLGAGVGLGPLPPNLLDLVLTIYRELAVGRPIRPEELARAATAAGVSVELAKGGGSRWLEFDEAGALVGFGGLTLRPTSHRLVLDETPLHLWCALDGLLIAHVLRRPVRIETRCPSSGTVIEVAAGPEGIVALAPRASVMSIVAPPASCACSVAATRRGFCDFVNFYESEVVARDAVKARGGAVMSIDAAFALAGLLIAPLMKRA